MRRLSVLSQFDDEEDDDGNETGLWQLTKTDSRGDETMKTNCKSISHSEDSESDNTVISPNHNEAPGIEATSTGNIEETDFEENDDVVIMPSSITLPLDMWVDLIDIASRCWCMATSATCSNSEEALQELVDSFRCIPLGPREDPDVALAQLMKDMKRETFFLDGERILGSSQFSILYNKVETFVRSVSDTIPTSILEHRVNRVLRACARTVSGYDAYQVVEALMCRAQNPRAFVTPGMMSSSPIFISFEDDNVITISSVNIFKVSKETENGSLDTVFTYRTEVTERIELDTWHCVRWISLKSFDAVRECFTQFELIRDRFCTALSKEACASESQAEKRSKLLQMSASLKSSMDLAMELSRESIRDMMSAEYRRGKDDILAEQRGVEIQKRTQTRKVIKFIPMLR